jgi:hypothetical protein
MICPGDPNTTDVVEENTKGAPITWLTGGGRHRGGNFGSVLRGRSPVGISGVAPRANIVTYRVCYLMTRMILMTAARFRWPLARPQAIADGADVNNYSIGSHPGVSPWQNPTSQAFLNLPGGHFAATRQAMPAQ